MLDFFFQNSAGLPEPNAQYNSMAVNLKVRVIFLKGLYEDVYYELYYKVYYKVYYMVYYKLY